MAADPVPLSNRLQKKGGRTPKRFEPEHPAKNPTMKAAGGLTPPDLQRDSLSQYDCAWQWALKRPALPDAATLQRL